jgi:membrane protein implicated in regulation of membrane protease activity
MRLTDFLYPARAFAFMAKLCAGLLILLMVGSVAIQALASARLTLGDLAGFLASWLILSLVAYAVRERRLAHRRHSRAQGAAQGIERERHTEEEA